MAPHSSTSNYLKWYIENQLVDGMMMCQILGVDTLTLYQMCNRGDLPKPMHVRIRRRGKKGRGFSLWSLPEVLRYVDIEDDASYCGVIKLTLKPG